MMKGSTTCLHKQIIKIRNEERKEIGISKESSTDEEETGRGYIGEKKERTHKINFGECEIRRGWRVV